MKGCPQPAYLDINHGCPADSELLRKQIVTQMLAVSHLTDFPSQYSIASSKSVTKVSN
jgi:hypothetical protein